MAQPPQNTLTQAMASVAARLFRRFMWLIVPVIGLFVAMAFHSALLTGVFELIIIIVIGTWIASFFGHDEYAFPSDEKRRGPSYLERDKEYLEEQMNTLQQEHEEQHRV